MDKGINIYLDFLLSTESLYPHNWSVTVSRSPFLTDDISERSSKGRRIAAYCNVSTFLSFLICSSDCNFAIRILELFSSGTYSVQINQDEKLFFTSLNDPILFFHYFDEGLIFWGLRSRS